MNLTRFNSFFFLLLATVSAVHDESRKKPTVLISILVRNKAHTLPYFLSLLDRLNYPKNRIHLWIRSDNNVDNSIEILNTWLESRRKQYHAITAKFDADSKGFAGEIGIGDWSRKFNHIINLREEALNYGRSIWADYIWVLDADVFLTYHDTLSELISKNKTIVAPLLKSDGMYSNFWAGMTNNYYYLRTDNYKPILYYEETGCFDVPMVHTAVLVDLRKTASDYLTYKADKLKSYNGPTDDIITFAVGASILDIPLFICNDNVYGFLMVPLEKEEGFNEDLQRLMNIKTEILAHDDYLPLSSDMEKFVNYPRKDTMGFDRVFMINLLRRPERRSRMERLFKELGIEVEVIDAVDGRELDDETLNRLGIQFMSNYADPYHKRPMTLGEIGCFLSHYFVWRKVMQNGYNRVIVLEDDVRFEPFFRQKIGFISGQLNEHQIDWDLVYLGRKRMSDKEESPVEGTRYLVRALYSYWTLGYLLSLDGAKKLVEAEPLKNLVPVDEYLPILADTHPREDWKVHYPKRDLIVLSSNPLLVHPTHYTGDKGYISDTENSASALLDQRVKESREEL